MKKPGGRVAALLLCLLILPAWAGAWKTSTAAQLSIKPKADGFIVSCKNTGSQTLAVLPLSSHWCHGWSIKVFDDKGREYGLVVPPGPAFMAEPDRFHLLKPKRVMRANFKYAGFSRVERSTDTIVSLKKPARIEVKYTMDPDTELANAMRIMQPMTPNSEPPKPNPAWQKLFKEAVFLAPIGGSLKI